MKRWMFFAAPVTVALILGLVVYALPASGSSTSLISRVAKLEAQTKALKASNAKLTKQVKAVTVYVGACLTSFAPISVLGDPASGSGYIFTPDNGATQFLAPALIITPQGVTPSFYGAGTTESACASSGSRKVLSLRGAGLSAFSGLRAHPIP